MNNAKIAAALRLLAEAFETPAETPPTAPAAPAPQKRGRGRPVAGEASVAPPATAVAASAPAPAPAAVEADPFGATPAAPAVPTATLDDVRKALTDLRAATTQDNALKVLKDAGGAGNLNDLKPEKYGVVVAAVAASMPRTTAPAPVVEADPFGVPTPTTVAPAVEKQPTLEDVRAVIVEAQKRTSTDTIQKVLMGFGGKGRNPDTGLEGPSLKALPEANFTACIAAVKALPTTK